LFGIPATHIICLLLLFFVYFLRCNIINRAEVGISRYWYRFCRLDHLSVCVSLCLSVWCIVAKWLIGSGCYLGQWVSWVSRDEAVSWDWQLPHRKGQFWGGYGHSIVTNWDFVA